jgi:Uma2 family endonuclease
METIMETVMETAIAAKEDSDFAFRQSENLLSDYERERGKPMPNRLHSSAQLNLSTALKSRYNKRLRAFPELTIKIGEATATPDIAVYPYFELNWSERVPAAEDEPPLLAVEIISPSQTLTAMLEKAATYFAHGVKSCWIVQPELRIISVLHPAEPPVTFTQGVVRDSALNIEISIEEVFE